MDRENARFAIVMILLIAIWSLLMFVRCSYANPEEPPLSKLHQWYPVQDGTVILEYRIVNKYAVQIWRYKHAQIAPAVKFSSCNEVSVNGDEVYLLTQEAKPSLYLIEKSSSGFSPEFNLDFTHEQ